MLSLSLFSSSGGMGTCHVTRRRKQACTVMKHVMEAYVSMTSFIKRKENLCKTSAASIISLILMAHKYVPGTIDVIKTLKKKDEDEAGGSPQGRGRTAAWRGKEK